MINSSFTRFFYSPHRLFKVHPADAYFMLKKMDIHPKRKLFEDFQLTEGKHVHESSLPWIQPRRLPLSQERKEKVTGRNLIKAGQNGLKQNEDLIIFD